jgi:hypothetical protein
MKKLILISIFTIALLGNVYSQNYKYGIKRSVDKFTNNVSYAGFNISAMATYGKVFLAETTDTVYVVSISSEKFKELFETTPKGIFLFKNGKKLELDVKLQLKTLTSSYSYSYYYFVNIYFTNTTINNFIESELDAFKIGSLVTEYSEGEKLRDILVYLKEIENTAE